MFECQNQFYFKQFSTIQPIDRALSSVTTPGQSGHRSDGYKAEMQSVYSTALADWTKLA